MDWRRLFQVISVCCALCVLRDARFWRSCRYSAERTNCDKGSVRQWSTHLLRSSNWKSSAALMRCIRRTQSARSAKALDVFPCVMASGTRSARDVVAVAGSRRRVDSQS